MKLILPILSLTLLFASCTTAYKSGQTPDDLYFSSARPEADYVSTKEEDKNKETRYESNEDRYLRMRVHNRHQWSEVDDYYYDQNAYTYSSCNCHCDYNPHLYWNNYYTPYGTVFTTPQQNNGPRVTNLNVYNSTGSSAPKSYPTKGSYAPVSQPRGNTGNNGSSLRNIFKSSSSSTESSTNSSSNSSSNSTNTNATRRRF